MNDIVYLKNDEAMTDSLTVAENFKRRHDDVVRSIEKLIERNKEVETDDRTFSDISRQFIKTRYKDGSGRSQTKYLMNRDGFALLVMGFNGKKAHEWKLKYIYAFNSMESIIRERSTAAWVETRAAGKLTRKAETDTLQRLVEYAKEQGSTHADMLYVTYTKLANKMAGVQRRDTASVMQLNNLSMMESIILHMVDTGIMMQKHYKEIYQDCKARLQTVSELAFIGAST